MRTLVRLLGRPAVEVGPDRYELPSTRPAHLFCVLATAAGWVERARLAYLFRPDAPEAVARHYVRNLLHRLGKLDYIPEVQADDLRCRVEITTDVARFRSAIGAGRWFEAIHHYTGPFLDGVDGADGSNFATWLEEQRRSLANSWREACLRYAVDQEASGGYAEAVDVLKRLVEHDPLDEDAVRACVRALHLAGNRVESLRVASDFLRQLDEELGLAPMPETLDLVARIRTSQGVTPHGTVVTAPPPPRSGGDASSVCEVEAVTAALLDPATRLKTLVFAEEAGCDVLIIKRRVRNVGAALHAVLTLIESLVAQGAYQRATELLVLVMTHVEVRDDELTSRAEAVWRRMERHLPEELLDAAMRRGDT